jgi:hypothetical protein
MRCKQPPHPFLSFSSPERKPKLDEARNGGCCASRARPPPPRDTGDGLVFPDMARTSQFVRAAAFLPEKREAGQHTA